MKTEILSTMLSSFVDSTLVKHLHQLYLEFLMLSILNYSQEKHRRERETKSHIKFDMEREEVNGT